MAANLTDISKAMPILFDPTNFTNVLPSRWNYVYYPTNRTLSNSSSDCYLAFSPYTPLIFPNGTFANATSCFAPINPLQTRGIVAILFGSFFAVTILFTLINLRKHGRIYLPRERRFQTVGRRWQWYWMLFVAVCGTTSCFTGVDVDRDYVLGLPMSLQCFFLTLMNPGLNAVVWECVRHWGSFELRRLLDADPFAVKTGDLSSRIEFYLPLVFYVFDWLVFFLTIPRNWNTVQKQRSPEQAALIAAPAATDMRFKAGSIVSAVCFGIIFFSLIHSRLRYRPSLRKSLIPWLIFGLATHTGYWVASAWRWDLNPFNLETDLGFQYSLDYLTALMIIIHSNIMGYLNKSDDEILLEDRAARGQAADGQLGLQNANVKPPWWSSSTSDRGKTKRDHDLEMKIFNIPGTHPRSIQEDESGSWWWQKRKEKKDSSNDSETELYQVKGSSMLQPEGPPLRRRTSQAQSEASGSGLSNYSTFEAKPQVVRSMVDM